MEQAQRLQLPDNPLHLPQLMRQVMHNGMASIVDVYQRAAVPLATRHEVVKIWRQEDDDCELMCV